MKKRNRTWTWWFTIYGDKKNVRVNANIPRKWLFLFVVTNVIYWAPSLWAAVQTALSIVQWF